MSKAFTKEDDGAGFSAPAATSLASVPAGTLRLTATGARLAAEHADPRVREALGRAEPMPPVEAPERAALGVTVTVQDEQEESRVYRLVPPEEVALLGTSKDAPVTAASIEAPIGRALLGATVGDVRVVRLPKGRTELEVVALDGE